MQCQLCQHVVKTLHPSSGYRMPKYYDNNGTRSIKLTSWQELQEDRNCPTCSLIVVLFYNEFHKHGRNPKSPEYELWLVDHINSCVSLNLASESYTSDLFFSIKPLSEESSELLGVVLDQDWVDLERVLEWIRSCDTTHGKCHCQTIRASGSFPSRDMYLISVSNNCLVKANKGDKYIALSYVWGDGSRQFKALKANLEFLRRKDSLSNTTTRDSVPGTIQRAMLFTSLLGLDLLWVDLFCIVQDDPLHSAAQINDMASIYSNSYLTLCAADGFDADSGLLGVPQCSQPRNMHQDILTFTDGVKTSKWVRKMYGRAVYDDRGWTFQEKVLSRRVLSFTNHGLEWRCQEVVSQEQDFNTSRPATDYTDLSIARADTQWPCLKKWDNLVSSYLKRTLTYEEDILRAFSGILGALDDSMLEGFHFGLPQQFFDAALLWVPMEQLTQRKCLGHANQRSEFPSWSWAGWKGAMQSQINAFGLGHLRSNLIIDHMPRLTDILPCVTWYKIDMDTLERARIPNDYAKYQSKGLEGTMTLPPGWSSYLDESDGPFYYRYNKAPSSHSFWYPIPTVRGIQPRSRRRWGPVLSFQTLRSHLKIGEPLSQEEQNDQTYPLYSLITETGEWSGVIYVHYLPEVATAHKTSCELVLISGGFSSENNEEQADWIPEWNFAKRPRSGDYYLFYHVLWIEWQGGIAYRRGLGRVVQTVWDHLPKDEVDVLLG